MREVLQLANYYLEDILREAHREGRELDIALKNGKLFKGKIAAMNLDMIYMINYFGDGNYAHHFLVFDDISCISTVTSI